MAAIKKATKKTSMTKMGNGGKIIKNFSKPISNDLEVMRNGGKVKPKMSMGGKMKKSC